MNGLKLLHAADLHLDSPFDALSGDRAAERRREQRELLSKIAETAEKYAVDMVLLSGDLLDSDSAFAETGEELCRTLGGMSCPVFIAPGNHDYYSAASPYAKLAFPKNVHIFKENRITAFELPELGARVYGAAFTDKYSLPLLDDFTAEADGLFNIMCIHGEINPASRYNAISEPDIVRSGLDYLALGHIHLGSGLRKLGGTSYSWPGCPEGRGFDETGEKYISIIGLTKTECRALPVCIAKRKYEVLSIDAGSGDILGAVLSALPEDTSDDIYRIVLRGESEEAPELSRLRAALEERFYALSIRDETVPRRDIWQRAGEDSLCGQFVARLKARYEASDDEKERETLAQAVRWGLAALTGGEEVVTHGDK